MSGIAAPAPRTIHVVVEDALTELVRATFSPAILDCDRRRRQFAEATRLAVTDSSRSWQSGSVRKSYMPLRRIPACQTSGLLLVSCLS
jgi:hypothetical protein